MDLKNLIAQAASKYGNTSNVVLKASESTGQPPCELFITDEHTENYLTLQMAGDADRGGITGIAAGVGSLASIALAFMMIIKGRWDLVGLCIFLAAAMFLIPFYFETRKPLPLPVLFNRRTKEVYFDQNGDLYHTPWDNIQAIACEFQMTSIYTGGINNASLEILVKRLGDPDNALMVSLGSPMGKTLDMQKGFWEYIRSYMNNGPWFDENGNHAESDEFIKKTLSSNIRPSDFLGYWKKTITDKKVKSGHSNYLTASDAFMFIGHLIFFPTNAIQDFTYNYVQRKTRNLWPEIVTERLHQDGPALRLIDLERERGFSV
ncbi:hypothetical protein [Pseudomonas sp. SC3(2021)]|uniref:hypothetical protein n=1 Tax=Pseudomonas sp. SC3(2021) TaxID=2871493 RepID=UPI001C9DB324|nr:hypothetical protein [Pseudomonas sp. SC3(2021)]